MTAKPGTGTPAKSKSKRTAKTGPLCDPAPHRASVDPWALMSSLPHPILVLGPERDVRFANTAAESFFQASVTVLQRTTLDELVPFGSPLAALVEQVQRSGSTVNEYGVDVSGPRMTVPRLVDIFGGPVIDGGGNIMVMLQQRTMAQMIERQLTHRAAARSVSGLAAVLAHEIKNPLSGIRGAAQLIEPSLGAEDQELARLICDETDRIRNLVDRMEVFGDERPIDKEPLNIHAVLDHVKKLVRSGVAQGVRIVEEYDPSLPAVAGNRDMLVQAFLNLVKNAAEAIDPARSDGRIVLATAFRPGVRLSLPGTDARVSLPLLISVEDNGGGIPDALKTQLFDPFVTSKRTGTGLGLALVAKIIGDHGGIIEWDSSPGRTIFRVFLPMDTRSSPRRSRPSAAKEH